MIIAVRSFLFCVSYHDLSTLACDYLQSPVCCDSVP